MPIYKQGSKDIQHPKEVDRRCAKRVVNDTAEKVNKNIKASQIKY